jgi:hypothetical protein
MRFQFRPRPAPAAVPPTAAAGNPFRTSSINVAYAFACLLPVTAGVRG